MAAIEVSPEGATLKPIKARQLVVVAIEVTPEGATLNTIKARQLVVAAIEVSLPNCVMAIDLPPIWAVEVELSVYYLVASYDLFGHSLTI